jgi:hypothetical protein
MGMQHIKFAFQKKGGTFNAYGMLFPSMSNTSIHGCAHKDFGNN